MSLSYRVKSAGRTAVLATAGLAGLVGLGGTARAEPIVVDTQPFTSWSQLYNAGTTSNISNNGDFYVNGNPATSTKAGAGL